MNAFISEQLHVTEPTIIRLQGSHSGSDPIAGAFIPSPIFGFTSTGGDVFEFPPTWTSGTSVDRTFTLQPGPTYNPYIVLEDAGSAAAQVNDVSFQDHFEGTITIEPPVPPVPAVPTVPPIGVGALAFALGATGAGLSRSSTR
jgi:hypothetical protein